MKQNARPAMGAWVESAKRWWKEDAYRRWIIIGGFVYAWFFSQGIPLWDDDFTSWFWKIKDQSLLQLVWQWVSPISTQPQYWGFNERPVQAIIYRLCYLVSGYEGWSYFLYKSVVYAGLGGMIYSWGKRLVPRSIQGTPKGNGAALAAAVFFLVAPGPMAAHILHQDLAPTAELVFLCLTYVIWGEIEKTPATWQGRPDPANGAHKAWLMRWSAIAFCTYLGYKTKADLKLIPMILAAYIAVNRRKQWQFFAVPLAIMCVLAVPWGPGIFSKLPPFVPGSKGSEVGWMWQPASFERLRDFLWRSDTFDFMASLKSPTISLAGLLGPFLLVGMLGFFGWRMEALDKVPWTTQETENDRSRTFVLIWFAAILAATAALPAINYIFRIRYGILPMVPASILLAWVFGLFIESFAGTAQGAPATPRGSLPKWAMVAGLAVFVLQAGINLNRSISYRRDMGQVMVAVDQVYERIQDRFPNEKLALLPDFRPYDYRPGASSIFKDKEWLASADELPKKGTPFKTYVISWKPSLWDQLEMVEQFSGCRETSLFDRLFPCPAGSGTYLMRYIGPDQAYAEGEKLRAQGDLAGARKKHEEFLAKYPHSMAGQFVVGLEAFQMQDWARSEQAYGELERYFPDHLAILYNRALALGKLKKYDAAIDRLRYIVAREPSNYAALINLYYTYTSSGDVRHAKKLAETMKKQFPNDQEVNRILASS